MDPGLLDVLHDGADHHLPAIADGVDIHLDGGAQETIQQHRRFRRHFHGVAHVAQQVFLAIDDLHGPSTQYIGGSHHQRIADGAGGLDGRIDAAHGGIVRLQQAQLLDHLLEALPVLGPVDGIGAGADDGHTLGLQGPGQLQRGLAAELHDDAHGFLQGDDFQHILQGDRFEIQPVGGVVVSRDGLRVAVDHDGLVAILAHGQGRVHAAVIELDTLADAVGAAADHQDLVAIGGCRLTLFLVGGIHIGGGGGEFGGTGVHALVHWANPEAVAMVAHLGFRDPQQERQALVGKALALEGVHAAMVDVRQGHTLEALLGFHQVPDLHQEPGIDPGVPVNIIQLHTRAEGVRHVPDALRPGVGQLRYQQLARLGAGGVHQRLETGRAHLQAAQGLLQRFLEGAADGHDLAYRLHLGSQAGIRRGEFLKGEARYLGDHVVYGGLERSRGRPAGDIVQQLIQGVAHRQLGRHLGNGEAGGLGGQGGGARHPGVHLDHHHAPGFRVLPELDIGAAGLDADLAQHRQRGVAHDLVFLVGQGLGRGHGDGVAGVHAHGIEVLDGADDDAVIVFVPHHLHFVLFPADQRLVYQQFLGGRQVQAAHADLLEFIAVVGDAATGAAHGERRADDAGETDRIQHLEGFLEAVGKRRAGRLQTDSAHGLVKQVAVLGLVDSFLGGADHLHAVGLQHALPGQVQGAVERRLAAHGGQQGIGLFRLDDARHRAPLDGLYVGRVGHGRVGHDGGRVRVHQDHPVPLFPQRLAGLRPGVVEFTGLADDDGAGAQDQDALDVSSLGHR